MPKFFAEVGQGQVTATRLGGPDGVLVAVAMLGTVLLGWPDRTDRTDGRPFVQVKGCELSQAGHEGRMTGTDRTGCRWLFRARLGGSRTRWASRLVKIARRLRVIQSRTRRAASVSGVSPIRSNTARV